MNLNFDGQFLSWAPLVPPEGPLFDVDQIMKYKSILKFELLLHKITYYHLNQKLNFSFWKKLEALMQLRQELMRSICLCSMNFSLTSCSILVKWSTCSAAGCYLILPSTFQLG